MMLAAVKNPLFIIRVGLASVFLWFGIDKIVHPIFWSSFIPEWVVNVLPFSVFTINYILSGVEIVLGLLLLLGLFTRKVAVVTALFMAGIILSVGYNDIAVRDFAILTMAIALALAKEHELTLDNYFRKSNYIFFRNN